MSFARIVDGNLYVEGFEGPLDRSGLTLEQVVDHLNKAAAAAVTKALQEVRHQADVTPASSWAVDLVAARENLAGVSAMLERLQLERAQFKVDYEGACKLVAQMHAAAVGEVRGPSVGPVEDVAAVKAERDRFAGMPTSAFSRERRDDDRRSQGTVRQHHLRRHRQP